MTKPELTRLLTNIAPVIRSFVEKKTGDVAAKVVALEARIVELESRQLRYMGTWDEKSQYGPGATVTFDGSMFVALTASISVRPGRGGPWQLAAKRGSDGRDLR